MTDKDQRSGSGEARLGDGVSTAQTPLVAGDITDLRSALEFLRSLPGELVTRLASVTDSERQSIADQWAATEEFELDGWDAPMVAETLEAICGQAGDAATRPLRSGPARRGRARK